MTDILSNVNRSEARRLAWHLPDDFLTRSRKEQEEILNWVRTVVISGSTEYRKYQADALKQRFSLIFNDGKSQRRSPSPRAMPMQLNKEMEELIKFKSSTLTPQGYKRNGVWGEETVSQKIDHLGLLFGALAASPTSSIKGLGVPYEKLTIALLAFPQTWDWYIQWREEKRGFYTAWEIDMLRIGSALTRKDTGWLQQNSHLSKNLKAIPGFIENEEITFAMQNWKEFCEKSHQEIQQRTRELKRIARTHRDPFEPILAILEAKKPLAEYKKIGDEILRLMPDKRRHPKAAAEAIRTYLMFRIGLHSGLRQKNLRQLLVCLPGQKPRSEKILTEAKRGELRWSEIKNGWEIFIPVSAFKNATSSFFGNSPFRLLLPDFRNLYVYIDQYLDFHRAVLLQGTQDPGTFFVKSVKRTTQSAEYDQICFYDAWRLMIQRYGIYNPYTNRGAIKGLLPHGPHNVRDILATHILKETGSYEQASYAIQDTPDMVAKHYGRFLPQDKTELAAQVLNKVWE